MFLGSFVLSLKFLRFIHSNSDLVDLHPFWAIIIFFLLPNNMAATLASKCSSRGTFSCSFFFYLTYSHSFYITLTTLLVHTCSTLLTIHCYDEFGVMIKLNLSKTNKLNGLVDGKEHYMQSVILELSVCEMALPISTNSLKACAF